MPLESKYNWSNSSNTSLLGWWIEAITVLPSLAKARSVWVTKKAEALPQKTKIQKKSRHKFSKKRCSYFTNLNNWGHNKHSPTKILLFIEYCNLPLEGAHKLMLWLCRTTKRRRHNFQIHFKKLYLFVQFFYREK